MGAHGTVRTATKKRLIEVLGGLEGFSTRSQKGLWMVTPPYTSKQLPNRRIVVIGAGTGSVEREGMEAGHGPSIDAWSFACGIACTDIRDLVEAEQACEDAFNAIADELARDGRLGQLELGVQELFAVPTASDSGADEQGVPTAWLDFDITCFAHIRRNP